MKIRSTTLLLTLAALMTSCSLYSTKRTDVVAVSYALGAKKIAIAKKKNKPNDTVNEWIGGIKTSAGLAAKTFSDKVDLSENIITPELRAEVKKQLGREPDLNALAGVTQGGKSFLGESGNDWLAYGKLVWEGIKWFNGQAREKQLEGLNKMLDNAEWGTSMKSELPPTKSP